MAKKNQKLFKINIQIFCSLEYILEYPNNIHNDK